MGMEKIEHTKNSPTDLTKRLAEENGLAIVVVDEHSSVQSEADNNSMCRVLYSSEEFAPRCDEYCGRAFEMAQTAGETVSYQCYAGLDCRAVPLKTERPLVAIVGRAFTKAENYRRATQRAIEGDWKQFPPTRIFENVLLSGSVKNLETVAKRLENLSDEEKKVLAGVKNEDVSAKAEMKNPVDEQASPADQIAKLVEQFHRQTAEVDESYAAVTHRANEDVEEMAVWRSLFGALFSLSYRKACYSILQFLEKRYGLKSLSWLERRNDHFEGIVATGTLQNQPFKLSLTANDERLLDALKKEISLEMRERDKNNEPGRPQAISLFPIAVGGEVQSGLLVADEITDENLKLHISRFCQTVASEIEILRLREEVKRRNWLANALERFNESLKSIDSDDFWANLMQISAELMRAERGSLLVFDEKAEKLQVKAAIGTSADSIKNQTGKIGERVAKIVLRDGKPVVVEDINKIPLRRAPSDWKYKSDSFISYPFIIGERKVGVLNVTDKADGASYSEFDLELLDAIAPQVAVLIDRASLKNKAGEYEQLSVTDTLTGLLNRRYLEQRLEEEIKRSNRYGYPMSFILIDIDDFGTFNKDFGVLIGDEALREVVKAMIATLRGADVAVRYGGEEFCVLFPQTTLHEASSIAERMRQSVEKIDFPSRKITVSIGVTTFTHDISTSDSIIKTADEALRQAKSKGKNNVRVYGD